MKNLKTNQIVVFLSIVMTVLSCKVLKAQTDLPKVENHLNGELDYSHEALELIKKQANGEEISLGKINTDGTIHFTLPEYPIKALYESINLQHHKLQRLFKINSECKDIDVFAETPFDDVYSEKADAIFIKQYGIYVAVLEAASESAPSSSTYFWFYIDQDITYKDECTKVSAISGDTYANIKANINFEKGWNFIEENQETLKTNSQGDSLPTHLSKIHFSKISHSNKKVKWSLRQIQEDEKIQTAKRLYNLTPISKEQFEKWPPKKLGDLSITTQEYGNPPKGQKNKNNMHLMYANEAQKKEIDLYVVDCAKNPDDMEMINFAFAMENDGKAEKDIKPYITQYNEREKATNLLYKVEDRIVVNASGVNIDGEALWAYIEKLNVEKLLKN